MEEDGGPAFARSPGGPGMSLRDYFAGQALSVATIGIASRCITGEMKESDMDEQKLAASCYEIADALLKHREESK